MGFQTFVTQRLAALTEMINAISSNAKKIDELQKQNSLVLSSRMHVSRQGTSEYIELQQIFDAIPSGGIQRQIHVPASTPILPSWNGATIIITASGVVLTVPAVLPANFTFDGLTRPGATCGFAITTPKSWVNGVPTLVPEKDNFVLMIDALNSNEVYFLK